MRNWQLHTSQQLSSATLVLVHHLIKASADSCLCICWSVIVPIPAYVSLYMCLSVRMLALQFPMKTIAAPFGVIVAQLRYVQHCWLPLTSWKETVSMNMLLLLSVMPVLLQLLLLLLRFITFDPGIAAATVGSVTRVDLKRGRLF